MILRPARRHAQNLRGLGDTKTELTPNRTNKTSRYVTASDTWKHSGVWAAVRLRADLVSSLPLDLYRRLPDGRQVELPKPQMLITPGSLFPGGPAVTYREWTYATQTELDRFGNCFGLKTRSTLGLPTRVDLVPTERVTVSVRGQKLTYRIGQDVYDPADIWHERQFVVPGSPVGLSAIAAAAMGVGQYLSAQQFALEWFDGGAIPSALLKNTAKTVDPKEAGKIKERFKASVYQGDLFVMGADWDYSMVSVAANQTEFLATQRFSIGDICRWFGVPGDMIDAETTTGSVTYANITQRNLQLLVMNLGPAIGRREDAFTAALPRPWYVKLNTNALLRMDALTRAQTLAIGVANRWITPDEIRAMDDEPPLTADQIEMFHELFPPRGWVPGDLGDGTSGYTPVPPNSPLTGG